MNQDNEQDRDRITNLDLLRGVAALAVCLFHFDYDGALGIPSVSHVLSYGYLGVQMFFVISGFIIPYSMLRSGYRIKNIKGFLIGRLVRLYPAYIIASVAALSMWYGAALTPNYEGEWPSFSLIQVISNIFLICDFTNTNWLITIAWTLAIEAQFYLLIALFFPLAFSSNNWIRRLAMALWIMAPIMAGKGPTVLTWTALFSLGMIVCQWKSRMIGWPEFAIMVTAAFYAHAEVYSPTQSFVGIATMCTIAFLPQIKFSRMTKIGVISYSLYLIHNNIAGPILHFSKSLPDLLWIRLSTLVLSVTISIAVASIFYRLIEKPSHALSRRLRKRLF